MGILNLMPMLRNSTQPFMKSTIIVVAALLIVTNGFAQSKKDKLTADAQAAKDEFIKTDSKMAGLFASSYGYAIFPNVGKGAVGVGGASGNGVAYEQGARVGSASMKQVTVGLQFGGQAYREVIFFEAKKDMDKFKENKIQLSAQVSAVAAAAGASANAKYKEGVLVFTMQKGGLMYEASVGGQKFKFEKDK
jgi:lipid-binding SYLF domain-containing protein